VTSPADRIPVRADLADLEPYGAPQLDVPVRLNTNETAEPPPDGYLQAVADRILGLELNRYPDRRHERLRALLGARVGLPISRVWAANGSNEVLAQLFQAYGGPGRRIATVRPGYSMYPVLARVTMTELVEVDLDDDFRWTDDVVAGLAATEPSIVILANPNNPTGVPVDVAYVRALHDAIPGALIIADEAYVEFAGDTSGDTVSAVGLLDELPRLVISRTFSKAFRLAGLRMGYLYGQDWVIDDIRRVRLPVPPRRPQAGGGRGGTGAGGHVPGAPRPCRVGTRPGPRRAGGHAGRARVAVHRQLPAVPGRRGSPGVRRPAGPRRAGARLLHQAAAGRLPAGHDRHGRGERPLPRCPGRGPGH
jgi:hypothetical protein